MSDEGGDVPAGDVDDDRFETPEPAPEPKVELLPAKPGHLVPGTDMPIVPADHEMAAMAQLATTLCAASTVPAALREKPNDVFLVLLTARDLGVSLTTAIREFHVIDGKVTLSPKVRKAMVAQQGLGAIWPDPANDENSATWYCRRADQPELVHASTFSMEDAKRVPARENQKAITLDQKSNWRAYPKRMLSWRALGYLLDDHFSEVGTGLYSPDEIGAVTDEEGNPVLDVTATDVLPGMREPRVQRRRQAQEADELASDEDRATVRARIARLASLEGARAALLTLWTEPQENGLPRLPTLDYLAARQVKTAHALIDSIEKRARGGEWGDWEPEPTPDETASEGEPVDEAAMAHAREIVARMEDISLVKDHLQARRLRRDGTHEAMRERLTLAIYEETKDQGPATSQDSGATQPQPGVGGAEPPEGVAGAQGGSEAPLVESTPDEYDICARCGHTIDPERGEAVEYETTGEHVGEAVHDRLRGGCPAGDREPVVPAGALL